jgi:signal transduction histidine kinase
VNPFKSSNFVKFRSRIQNTQLFYYLFPILIIFIFLGVYFYLSTEDLLDQELGKRLTSISVFSSNQVKSYQLSSLNLFDSNNLTSTSLKEKFNEIRNKNEMARIFLFNRDNQSLLDTDRTFAPGIVYERNSLHSNEIEKAWNGQTSTTLHFKNQDGQHMKSAFAPVLDDQNNVVAVLGIDGNATFFESLQELEQKLIFAGLLCIVVIIVVSLFLSKKIVNPIHELVNSARKIGDGYLDDPIQIKTSNEIGFLGYVLDEMRKKIIERDQELQVMLRGIAHEVRNPLGGIELFAGILEEQVKDEKSKQAVAKIQKEVLNLKNLVEDFLNFAKKPSLQTEVLNAQEFFDEVRLYFSQALKNASVQFDVRIDDVKTLRADPYHLERVFLNLVNNSIQATPTGGSILIEVLNDRSQVKIVVSDTGAGIPEQNMNKIFDPFFTTREYGNGLGLSFVQKIIQAHGGTIAVESALDKGTKMIITLPSA